MGKGVGPLLISKQNIQLSTFNLQHATIALPGKNTTANLLFSFAYPAANNKKHMIFSAIEESVLNEQTELGVIIHENRFTYQQRGLHKVTDLGELWEKKMHVPIPLGGIAASRSIDKEVSLKIDRLIKMSIEFAFSNYPVISDHVKEHSQEMNEDVMRQHIDLYVNNFSIDLGKEGKQAIETLYKVAATQLSVSSAQLSSDMFLS